MVLLVNTAVQSQPTCPPPPLALLPSPLLPLTVLLISASIPFSHLIPPTTTHSSCTLSLPR